MKIRMASAADSSALLKIYAQYIHTPITFECALPTEADFTERIKNIIEYYPYLVCEENGKIIGFAYAHRQKEREAYQWNAELSVYIDRDFTTKGIGSKLYNILIELLKLQGVRTVYGGVTLPNPKSEGLHLSMGFHRCGVHRNTGYKCGKWHDVAWFEKTIGLYDENPNTVVPICKVDYNLILQVIQSFYE